MSPGREGLLYPPAVAFTLQLACLLAYLAASEPVDNDDRGHSVSQWWPSVLARTEVRCGRHRSLSFFVVVVMVEE